MKKINYYKTYEDDFVTSQNQDYKVPENYKWINNNIFYKISSKLLYFIAYIFSFFYCKLFLHVKIKNREMLKTYKNKGYFLYGNHTQPIGDVFIPAHVCKNKRIYVIASPANLKVKGIGRFLPMLGILPIPDTKRKMVEFLKAVKNRINENKCVVIYPEAHVWPYYTKIRPFPVTSFKFPIENDAPVFCMTTTYYKRKFGSKPGINVYIDGPFFTDKKLTKKENQNKLCEDIYNKMVERSKESTYEYIEYRKEE